MSRQRVSKKQVGRQVITYGVSGEYTRTNRCTTKKVRERKGSEERQLIEGKKSEKA